MADYRYQVVSVGMWRGKIKRWNTTYHHPTNTATLSLRDIHSNACYKAPGDVVGACSGGVASIAVYAPTGGAPLSNTVFFDWEAPNTWIPFLGSGWAGTPAGTTLDASGESAMVVVGHLPGLSKTGKPMTTRKYIHAVPSRTAAAYSDPDIDAATLAQLKALFPANYMDTAAGIQPSSVEVLPYYGNHQRVRGRRRTVTQVAAQSFSAGVLAGAATTGGGGGTAPQFQ